MPPLTLRAPQWQHSAYFFHKPTARPLPTAAQTAHKLITAYITMKRSKPGQDARARSTAMAVRRKGAEKVYVSTPSVRDFGTSGVEVTAFVYDGAAMEEGAGGERQTKSRGAGRRDAKSGGEGSKQLTPATLLDPTHSAPLQALLAKIYRAPVSLKLLQLRRPHLDASILAGVIAQTLRDRRNSPLRILRRILPSARSLQPPTPYTPPTATPAVTSADLTLGSTAQRSPSTILSNLALHRVNSVFAAAAGRLTKRLTANRSVMKSARRGASGKGSAYMVRGVHKAHLQPGRASGKRRTGAFGIKVLLGHGP